MPLVQWRLNLGGARQYYGLLAGGTAENSRILNPPIDGGGLVGGNSLTNAIYNIFGSGGLVVGGHAAGNIIYIDGIGGAVLGGTAANVGITRSNIASGGVVIGGNQTTNGKVINESGVGGGLVIGGSGSVTGGNLGNCRKAELPNHPKPSTADYRPANVSPLIDFFVPLVIAATGSAQTNRSIVFRYENNTPCRPEDDIFVPHADVVGHSYKQPVALKKSKELIAYEKRAKVSKRLIKFMQESPAAITYFEDVVAYGNLDYPPGNVYYPPVEDILGIFK